MLKALVEQSRPDWTSRQYKKFVKVARVEKIYTARKCAIKLGVSSAQINAALTLLGIETGKPTT
jgi:hypothetical protein